MALENRDRIRNTLQEVSGVVGTRHADVLLEQAIDMLLKELLDVMKENFDLSSRLTKIERIMDKHNFS